MNDLQFWSEQFNIYETFYVYNYGSDDGPILLLRVTPKTVTPRGLKKELVDGAFQVTI